MEGGWGGQKIADSVMTRREVGGVGEGEECPTQGEVQWYNYQVVSYRDEPADRVGTWRRHCTGVSMLSHLTLCPSVWLYFTNHPPIFLSASLSLPIYH